MKAISGYLALTRYREWTKALVAVVAGLWVGNSFSVYGVDIFLLAGALLSAVLLWSYGFAINDCFDAEFDKLKKGNRNPVSGGMVNKKSGIIFSLLLSVAGLAAAYILIPKALYIYIVFFLVFSLYSVPPFRLKELFPFDMVFHGLFLPLTFMLGYLSIAAVGLFSVSVFFLLFLGSSIPEILQEIRDYKTDSKSGFRTTAIVLGVQKSIALLKAISITGLALAVLTVYYFLPGRFLVFILAALPYMHFLFFKRRSDNLFDDAWKAINRSFVLFILAALFIVLTNLA